MDDLFRYIDDHLNESLAELTELCKLPTVSAQKSAIGETAEHVCGLLRDIGFESQILAKASPGHPVVYAEQAGASPRTLLFYDHYDVQPPEPLELWSSPPFQPTLRDGKLYGRGVSDNKGNIAARLAALRGEVLYRGGRGDRQPSDGGVRGGAPGAAGCRRLHLGGRRCDLGGRAAGHPGGEGAALRGAGGEYR